MVYFVPEPIGQNGNQGTPKVPGVDGFVPQASVPYNPGQTQMRPAGFSFGALSGPNSIFYNDPNNRGVGWQMFKDYLNRGGNTRYDNYLDSLMGQEYNRYLSANAAANGKLKWTDWITQRQNYAPQQWMNLPSVARGAQPGLYGASQVYLG